MSMTNASVIVPSYKGVRRLPRLLNALADQDFDGNFEAIIVIDGVDDGSVELVHSEDRFHVQAIVFPENKGRVAALNAGFETAQGDVLIRCDDDLEPSDDYVRRHVDAHLTGPVGAVGLYLNEYEDSRYKRVYGEHADRDFRDHAYSVGQELTWRYWAGNCSITRDVWEKIGSYDPEYRLYGWEDVDYGFRIHKAGIPIVLHPTLETPHHIAAVTTELRAQRAFHSAAARRIFEAKHGLDHLPPAVPAMSLWNGAVRGTSRLIGSNPKRVGGAVDKVISRVPDKVAKKLVALTVEASAIAGYRQPESAQDVF